MRDCRQRQNAPAASDPHSRDLQRRMQYRACYDSALDRAVDKIGSRELQALHATGAAHNVG